ncbi:MAG: HDOD domain-containing protein [Proteobacteria bacterium]|nr:HDOD domain-containing protein [Pseudomonadota bacterium]
MTTDENEKDVLVEEIEQRLAPGKSWKEIVAWVGDLPPLPHVATKALSLIENPDTTAAKLTKLLGEDAALAARVLKISNSAMFSRQREITTLNQAIMTIGFKTLKGVIVAATLRQLNRGMGKHEQIVWENSTFTGMAARALAVLLRKPYSEEVFLLGLLHDLGKLVLLKQVPKEYKEIIEKTRQGVTFAEVEHAELGFSHQLIGALVAKKWNFSLEICQVILHHHDDIPDGALSVIDEKTAIIQAADLASHVLGKGHLEGYPDKREEAIKLFTKLGIKEEDFETTLVNLETQFKEGSSAFM